ncbi:MAG: hypothetical protein AAGF47_01145 [Planctomycetota bacterium]
MTLDDPKIQAALFGVLLPAIAGGGFATVSLLLARSKQQAAGDPDSVGGGLSRSGLIPSIAGLLPAVGLGAAYAIASLGLVGVPGSLPRAMVDWLLPIVTAGVLVATVPMLLPRGLPAISGLWLARAAFIAAVLIWPIANTRANHWEGAESIAWHISGAIWLLTAFASMARVSRKASPVMMCVLLGVSIAGLIPVVFGAGVTSHPQVSGGLAAGVGGLGVVAIVARGRLPIAACGSVFVAWLTASLLVGWQFVADMAWWEFGVVAAIPLVLAAATFAPKLRSFGPVRLGVVLVVLAGGMTAAVSARHVPAMVAELTGSRAGSGDSLDDYYGF